MWVWSPRWRPSSPERSGRCWSICARTRSPCTQAPSARQCSGRCATGSWPSAPRQAEENMANETLDIEQFIGWEGLLQDEEKQVRASVRRIVKERFMPRIVADYETGKFALELVPDLAK